MRVLKFAFALMIIATALGLRMAAIVPGLREGKERLEAEGWKLTKRLGSSWAEERSEARAGLLALGAAAVLPLIVAAESENATLRWEAVNLLGALGDLRATGAVLQVALGDPDVHARWRANWAVTCLDDGTVVPRLIAALDEQDPTVAWNAAVTLTLFGRSEAVPLLHQGLNVDGWQQWEAVNALGRAWKDDTASKLIRILQEGSEDVRKEATLSLGHIGGDIALDALLTALQSDPSPEVRWRAAMMIGRIGDEETAELLMEIRAAQVHPLVIEHIDEAIEALTSP